MCRASWGSSRTEYLELEYTDPVFVSSISVGENRGMGSVRYIRALDPSGAWMTIYDSPVDPTIQTTYARFNKYRVFSPPVCRTPFKTRRIRVELDTRTAPDWNEIDYVKLEGALEPEHGLLPLAAAYSVVYVPFPGATGPDSFAYAASDCPFLPSRWSDASAGLVSVNLRIPPAGGMAVVGSLPVPFVLSAGAAVSVPPVRVDLSAYSATPTGGPLPGYTITRLPASGALYHVLPGGSSSALPGARISSVPAALPVNASGVVIFQAAADCAEQVASLSFVSTDVLSPVSVALHGLCSRLAVDATSPVASLAYALALLVAAVSAYFAWWIVAHWSTQVVMLSQPRLCIMYIVGGVALQASWLTFT